MDSAIKKECQMPLTAKGEKIKEALTKEYGEKKGEQVLYAGKNKGTFTGIDSAKMDALCDAVATLGSRVDAMETRRDATSVATEEKRWLIRGIYPNGNKLQFYVSAFNHTEAKKKAEARKGGAKITDVVLNEK